MISKTEWRKLLLQRRKALSPARRQEAAERLFETLKSLSGNILSFSPMGSEIDTSLLNRHFDAEGRLSLVPYRLDALTHIPLEKIDCILVPGLGFDRQHTRLGYGKGYYDQFLATARDIKTIGVGFQEQLCEAPLPKDPWDIPVQELLLT